MDFHDRPRLSGDRRRPSPAAPLSCDRGGPVHKIDRILVELLDQYRIRYPELRAAIVHTSAEGA